MRRKLLFKTLKKFNKNLVKDTKFSKVVISQSTKPRWSSFKSGKNQPLGNLIQVSFNFKSNFQKQKEYKFFFNNSNFFFKINPKSFYLQKCSSYKKLGFLLAACKFFKSFNSAKQFIRSGGIQVNKKLIYSPNYNVKEGDLIFIPGLKPVNIYKSFFYIKINEKTIFQKNEIPSTVEISFSSKSLVFCYFPTLFDLDCLGILFNIC